MARDPLFHFPCTFQLKPIANWFQLGPIANWFSMARDPLFHFSMYFPVETNCQLVSIGKNGKPIANWFQWGKWEPIANWFQWGIIGTNCQLVSMGNKMVPIANWFSIGTHFSTFQLKTIGNWSQLVLSSCQLVFNGDSIGFFVLGKYQDQDQVPSRAPGPAKIKSSPAQVQLSPGPIPALVQPSPRQARPGPAQVQPSPRPAKPTSRSCQAPVQPRSSGRPGRCFIKIVIVSMSIFCFSYKISLKSFQL